eukprot:CAMPEP_0178936848 /NCGR_PEP_ID=MMETSP0786-20121207/25414_1 /TAXON_ID=186022 /ORGANISM="Thalassionema frauenfeldii, Strain CCMP 1798" /LENGTH=498 /DNA_ID=CAMNT_0020615323 /DNA_START=92 /DNA_END=1588 /DNA_ORIENTATION=+
MGGGVSRFEETDWQNATGKLTQSKDTIDGSPPTQKYGVYYLHKTGANQREYHVTDEDSNLLYSSRMIEGTLAWFDLLGPGLDEFLLRVQVDLSRRYWVIYSYGGPSYAGQFADMTATNRVRQEQGSACPCLYKKACITVTWSRYEAIINLYGPPPEYTEESISEDEQPLWALPAESESPRVLEGSEIVREEKKEACNCSDIDRHQDQFDKGEESSEDALLRESFLSTPNSIDGSGRTISSRMSSVRTSVKQVKGSVKQWVADKTSAPPPNPLEGHLQLDKPILKCEEINTIMTGQHQTMLVGKEEAKKLEKEELETALHVGTNAHNPNANLNSDSVPTQQRIFEKESDQSLMEYPEEKPGPAEKARNNSPILKSSSFSSVRNFAKLAISQVGDTMDRTKSIVRAKSNPDYQNYNSAKILDENTRAIDPSHSSRKSVSSQGSQDAPLEPLIGFWNWDNTMRVHKMKMHLAKDSDLALHVILAIVTNQLRLERNVVVSTV